MEESWTDLQLSISASEFSVLNAVKAGGVESLPTLCGSRSGQASSYSSLPVLAKNDKRIKIISTLNIFTSPFLGY